MSAANVCLCTSSPLSHILCILQKRQLLSLLSHWIGMRILALWLISYLNDKKRRENIAIAEEE